MDRATLSTQLQQLGLSEQDARTYLAALEREDGTTTTTIADETSLDESAVDESTRRLAARGFVMFESANETGETDETERGRDHETTGPSTIYPRPPATVLESIRTTLDSLEDGFGVDAPATGSRLPFDVLETRSELLERLAASIEGATEEVALSIPASMLADLEDELRDAVQRDVLVALLVSGDEEFTADRFEEIASVARVWSRRAPVIGVADYGRGVVASNEMGTDSEVADEYGILLDYQPFAFVLMGSFFGSYWRIATQLFETEPDPLPRTYTNIRRAVFQATLRLEAGTDVHVTAEARPVGDETFDTVEGRLVDVRQSLLEPVHESFAIENALIVEREDSEGAEGERITLGGEGAFVEELQTRSIRLSALESA
ncbi:TrmB family transcriptional regulator [Halobacteria archaeon AArc-m2/3/4]|uniref:TrmB family transcriptional regulator n=1 Tax=Natronoglomus mannanivorans TaxID=2979990 RepID=A0AAP2YWC4_9EURY|nr:TrmB family transcriptional regulator [Halobacteria archaeon AArc-xg1-1]MCU4971677.1 TrmB family transcriptional regulator [Halobacteria archaeon AArc-m2/3/4]